MRRRFAGWLQWITSIVFFLLAMTKVSVLQKYGLQPYEAIIQASTLPGVLKYYGVVAIALEFYLAVGVWMVKTYSSSIKLMMVLNGGGICLSIYFIAFRLNTECGCGLLGDNEYGLLAQKLIIMILLVALLKNRDIVFALNKSG